MAVCFGNEDNREHGLVNWIKKAFVNKQGNIQPTLCPHNYRQLSLLKETKSSYWAFSICDNNMIYEYLLLLISCFIL